jgi:hypothetical protein
MLTTLIEIAWGERANALNQGFSILLIIIFIVQAFRLLVFWDKINQWTRAFVSAKIAFDQEHVVKIESQMDELQPPHAASDQFWLVSPPMIIMFGLIGTFVGLTLALAVIPFGGSASEIQAGVQKALPSMGSAFWTSLSAICSAMIIRLTTMLMESMFNRRVLKVIVSAHPHLIQYIEREAFIHNRPGALLRPHSLREVLWQQNSEFTRQIERLGTEISSSIRELPYALPSHISDQQAYTEIESKEEETVSTDVLVASPSQSTSQDSSTSAPLSVPDHLLSESSVHLILTEMQKQTQLLEQLLSLQHRSISVQRITQSTQGFESLKLTPLPTQQKRDGER